MQLYHSFHISIYVNLYTKHYYCIEIEVVALAMFLKIICILFAVLQELNERVGKVVTAMQDNTLSNTLGFEINSLAVVDVRKPAVVSLDDENLFLLQY